MTEKSNILKVKVAYVSIKAHSHRSSNQQPVQINDRLIDTKAVCATIWFHAYGDV